MYSAEMTKSWLCLRPALGLIAPRLLALRWSKGQCEPQKGAGEQKKEKFGSRREKEGRENGILIISNWHCVSVCLCLYDVYFIIRGWVITDEDGASVQWDITTYYSAAAATWSTSDQWHEVSVFTALINVRSMTALVMTSTKNAR